MSRERWLGGVAAFVQALCYVVGFVILATVMNPGSTEAWTPTQKLAFILDRQGLFTAWTLIIYVVFGVALVVLTAVLHRLLQSVAPLVMSIATPFGVIWAGLVIASGMVANVGIASMASLYESAPEAAAQAWSTIAVVQNGLGGGVELVGGIWVLCISLVAGRSSQVLPTLVNLVGLVVGVCGIATMVPELASLGAVFGLTQILWFFGVGIALIRARGA